MICVLDKHSFCNILKHGKESSHAAPDGQIYYGNLFGKYDIFVVWTRIEHGFGRKASSQTTCIYRILRIYLNNEKSMFRSQIRAPLYLTQIFWLVFNGNIAVDTTEYLNGIRNGDAKWESSPFLFSFFATTYIFAIFSHIYFALHFPLFSRARTIPGRFVIGQVS